MSDVLAPVHGVPSNRDGRRYGAWHAVLFWMFVNLPGWVVPWREDLFPGFQAPALRPPGEVFPVVWFVITVAALVAGLRVINRPSLPRRTVHLGLQAAFWAIYLIFPLMFFGLSSPIMGFVLTFAILCLALLEVWLLWRDDRRAAFYLLPLLIWSAFAGLYVAPVQAFINPDPLFGTPPLLGSSVMRI